MSPGTVSGPVARIGLPPWPPADERPGADVETECVLVGLGIRSQSMAPGLIPAVRLVLAAHSLTQCGQMATTARTAHDATTAKTAVRQLADPKVLDLL